VRHVGMVHSKHSAHTSDARLTSLLIEMCFLSRHDPLELLGAPAEVSGWRSAFSRRTFAWWPSSLRPSWRKQLARRRLQRLRFIGHQRTPPLVRQSPVASRQPHRLLEAVNIQVDVHPVCSILLLDDLVRLERGCRTRYFVRPGDVEAIGNVLAAIGTVSQW